MVTPPAEGDPVHRTEERRTTTRPVFRRGFFIFNPVHPVVRGPTMWPQKPFCKGVNSLT